MKNKMLLRGASVVVLFIIALSISCVDDDRITTADTEDISEEALTESYFVDMDDMTGVTIEAPTDDQYSVGRTLGTITVNDDRFKCAGVVVTITVDPASTRENPKGVITVDFGTTGCEVRGNTRTGKLIFTYSGRRFMPGSKVITTTDNYAVNGIKLEGTRTLTNVTTSTTADPKFNVKLENGKATFEGGVTATRNSDITWSWNRNGTPFDLTDDRLIIDQNSNASGTTRGGRTYEMTVTQQLEHKRFCGGIPISGIKRFLIDGEKEIIINYGDGECDKEVTITINNTTRTITVRK